MPTTPGQMLAEDAAATVRRIRRDVAHAKDLGRLAIIGVRAAAMRARKTAERAIDHAAGIIEAARGDTSKRGGRF